jgi:hypothetical protein
MYLIFYPPHARRGVTHRHQCCACHPQRQRQHHVTNIHSLSSTACTHDTSTARATHPQHVFTHLHVNGVCTHNASTASQCLHLRVNAVCTHNSSTACTLDVPTRQRRHGAPTYASTAPAPRTRQRRPTTRQRHPTTRQRHPITRQRRRGALGVHLRVNGVHLRVNGVHLRVNGVHPRRVSREHLQHVTSTARAPHMSQRIL